jgi:hypothetical protein
MMYTQRIRYVTALGVDVGTSRFDGEMDSRSGDRSMPTTYTQFGVVADQISQLRYRGPVGIACCKPLTAFFSRSPNLLGRLLCARVITELCCTDGTLPGRYSKLSGPMWIDGPTTHRYGRIWTRTQMWCTNVCID